VRRIGRRRHVVVAGLAGLGGGVDAQTAPIVSPCGTALVAIPELDELLPIDLTSRTLGAPITVPGAYSVAVSPDARTAWVIGDHSSAPVWTLLRVDLTTGLVGPPLSLDSFLPQIGPVSGPVITPDGATLLIGTSTLMTTIDVETMTIGPPIDYNAGPFIGAGLALTPDAKTVFVGNALGSEILTVNLPSRTVGPLISTGLSPGTIALTPDGATAFTADNLSSTVTPIDVASLTPSAPIATPGQPSLINVSPAGDVAAVSVTLGIASLDLATRTMSPKIGLAGSVMWQGLTADGATAWVETFSPNELVPVEVRSGTVGTPIPLPGVPFGGGVISPSQAPHATFSSAVNGAAGLPTTLDASGSQPACGDITSYAFSFGDGTPDVVTSSPEVQHTYETPGRYTATVAVTDSSGTSTARVYTGQSVVRNGGPDAETSTQVSIAPAPQFTG
jgi:hypothetical protein